jgi:hypothetical protein
MAVSLNGDLFARPNAIVRDDLPKGSIVDRSVCLSLELRRLGTRRRVASDAVQTDADPEMISVSKEILESEVLDKIKSLDGEIRDYVNRRTVPGMSLFRAGCYLVRTEIVAEIDAKLERYAERRQELVDLFMEEYEDRMSRDECERDEARRLGSLYDATDYKSAEKVRRTFSMETRYIAFSTPDKLASISSDIYQREQDKGIRAIHDATVEITNIIRAEFAELVDHAVDKLTVAPGEKPKVFRDSLIGNIESFLDTFADRNLADDADLADLVARARSLVRDPKDLRDIPSLRASVAESFTAIKATLDTMIVDKPARKIAL